jgi:hypothetical protein
MRMKSKLLSQVTPSHLALGAGVLLVALHLSLLLVGLRLEGRAQGLQEARGEIMQNLSQLREAEEQGLQALEGELASAHNHLEELKASFPEIGAGFNIYRRGFELAGENDVQVEGIQRLGSSVQSTVVGSLQLTGYMVRSQAPLHSCLSFVSALEAEGLGTLAVKSFQILPETERCDFNLDIASVQKADPTE